MYRYENEIVFVLVLSIIIVSKYDNDDLKPDFVNIDMILVHKYLNKQYVNKIIKLSPRSNFFLLCSIAEIQRLNISTDVPPLRI